MPPKKVRRCGSTKWPFQSDAPNPEGAHVFLNFIMDAQNMADASNYVYYANGNPPHSRMLEEDVIGDPAIYPDAAHVGKPVFTTRPYPAKNTARS